MITGVVALLCLLLASSASANIPDWNTPLDPCGGHHVTAAQFAPFSHRVWKAERWQRGRPDAKAIRAYRHALTCAAGPGHRHAIRATWRRDRHRYFAHRRSRLDALSINHVWEAHWAPDWSGPTLPDYVIAALAEEAGDYIGADVPGLTMAQMTVGESGGRPGSAGVDVGGTRGYGLWAITWPHADAYLARYGWTYEDMWNPVRNAVIMAEMYADRGTAPWYGDDYVTDWDAHYTGRFDLRLVLGGLSFAQALRR